MKKDDELINLLSHIAEALDHIDEQITDLLNSVPAEDPMPKTKLPEN